MTIDTIITKRFLKTVKKNELPVEIMYANVIDFTFFLGMEILSSLPPEITSWRIRSITGLIVMDYMPVTFKKVNVHVPLLPHEILIVDFCSTSEVPDFIFDCAMVIGIKR